MTIWQRMSERNLSRYQLANICGLSWAEINNICCGKKPISQCAFEVLSSLGKALDLSPEAVSALETEPQDVSPDWEAYLPEFLQKSIRDLVQGEQERVSYLDCLYDDLYGSVNAAQWGGIITKEQACQLREKYLFGKKQEETE